MKQKRYKNGKKIIQVLTVSLSQRRVWWVLISWPILGAWSQWTGLENTINDGRQNQKNAASGKTDAPSS